MDKLNPKQKEGFKKLSTERLCARLVASGYEEDLVFSTDHLELLNWMAEQLLKPPVVAEPNVD